MRPRTDTVLVDGAGTRLRVSYTGPAHQMPDVLALVAADLAEHGPASVFWPELRPAQRRLLTTGPTT
ncbi:hypothetical protein [Catellatospora chokoriensis]|uniref:Uncharacterized protein n=1 Tax=Catellatospora chokoriensis TaxID=310353 RepID=A0A8J3NRY8_9ACTN|nr:hypothetical protein [Catellatospora chokoriensis]GIF90475.1 hypothetical protein Cch02nite_39190 [Catellatospora chokoriensis]